MTTYAIKHDDGRWWDGKGWHAVTGKLYKLGELPAFLDMGDGTILGSHSFYRLGGVRIAVEYFVDAQLVATAEEV